LRTEKRGTIDVLTAITAKQGFWPLLDMKVTQYTESNRQWSVKSDNYVML
jgi:hypothetical protein